jgi:hypothetical protein
VAAPKNRDTWLHANTPKARAQVRKAAVESGGHLEPSSDVAFRLLTEDPRDRAARAHVTEWGGRSSDRVAVVKRGGDAGGDQKPPESRQLRDPFTTFYVQGIALEPPLPPDRMLNLTEENTLHAACLLAKAVDACGRGWSFEPREGKENDKTLIQSEVPGRLKQTMEDITPELTFGELLVQAAWEKEAIGWSAWEVVRAVGAEQPGTYRDIGAIYPIPAHTIRASLDPRKWIQIRAGRVRYFKKFGADCTINNETGTLLEWTGKDKKLVADMDPDYVASELIIFKEYTPRSLWYGVPKWVSAIATVAELTAIREFNISWFASGGQTDYHMHFTAESLETAKEMVGQVRQQVQENAGRGHTNLLTAGGPDTTVKVEKLGELLREGHFRFRRGDLAKEILIAHAVPPYRIGWAETGSLGGNAAPEMLTSYKFGAVKPIQAVIEDRLRITLFDPTKGIKTDEFRFALRELELDDVAAELGVVSSSVKIGIMTPNQGREQLDLDPMDPTEHPEMDVFYFNGQPLGAPKQEPGGAHGGPPGAEPGSEGEPGAEPAGEGEPGGGKPPADPAKTEAERAYQAAMQDAEDTYQAALGTKKPAGTPKEKSAPSELYARRAVVEMLRDYEAKLKSALADDDPVDSPQPPPRKPKRGQGASKPVSVASPTLGAGGKPDGVSG